MLKQNFFSKTKRYQQISTVLVVLTVAVIGTLLLISSHAATPYSTVAADKGTLTGVATIKTDSTASDGKSVVFGTTNQGLCGFATGTPQVNKIMIIWEENHSLTDVTGSPYFDKMATSCGSAVNYFANTHPSLPNYMAITSGVSYASNPWNTDCWPTNSGCNTSNASVFSQLGTNWKSYAEDMPGSCVKSDSGEYAVKHNPAAYYTNIATACSRQDVPLGTSTSGNLFSDVKNGALPALTTVTPNLINDMHDGTVLDADNWLKVWVPIITAGSDYQTGHLAIIVMGDENEGSGSGSNQTFAFVLSAYTRSSTQSSTSFNDYSVTRTIEDITGQPAIGNAAGANSMVSAFNL